MTFFFFVLGLEARREFDLGDFREGRRFVLPLPASVGGMGAAAAINLALNLGSSAAEGWSIAMSTDTAFALGLLTLFGRRAPERLRAFMLTVVIADVRHAHVLHQRAPSPRRVRHRHPVARSPRRRRPRQAGGVVALTWLAGCGPSSRSGSAGLAVDQM